MMNKKYDLNYRLFKFSKNCVNFCLKNRKEYLLLPILNQLIKSATSINANYIEANESNSHKDFLNKVKISKKEAGETEYWLKLLKELDNSNLDKENVEVLYKESMEITKIISKIYYNYKDKYQG